MNHAITVGGLLLGLGLVAGFLIVAFGALSLFANMMADAQGDGGNEGCIALLIGLVLFVGCLVGIVA